MSSLTPRVAALMRSALGSRFDGGDLEQVFARADELSIVPLVVRYGEAIGAPLPEAARARWRDHRAGLLLVGHQLERVEDGLVDVPHLVLKGQPLARRIFGDAEARQVTDIDVLVCPEQVGPAIDALCAIGWVRDAARPEPWVNNQTSLGHPTLGVRAEVHWALALPRIPSPSVEEALSRAVKPVGEKISVLDPELGLLYACYHFHHHVGFLKGLFDVAGWLDSHGQLLDWDWLQARARQLGVLGVLQWPTRALAALTGISSPLDEHPADPWVRAWARWTARATRGVLAREGAIRGSDLLAFKSHDLLRGHAVAWNALGMTVLDGSWTKVRGALHPLFRDPTSVAASRGRSRPSVVDYARVVARPVELLAKQVADLARGRRAGSGSASHTAKAKQREEGEPDRGGGGG